MATLLRQRGLLVETLYIPETHVRHGKTYTYKLELARLQENNASVIKLSPIFCCQKFATEWPCWLFHVFSSLRACIALKSINCKKQKNTIEKP